MEVLGLKALLNVIVKSLVDNPDDVEILQIDLDGDIRLEITVHPDEVGKIIGKQGRIAKAIRTLMKAYAIKENKRVNVEIMQ